MVKSHIIKQLKECLVSDSIPSNKKIKKSSFKQEGKFPIVDQSENFIAGFTDDENKVFGAKPVIIFGDHTKRLKYIDFDFCVGADGTKVLIPNTDLLIPKFLYYQLKFIPITDAGYSRHYKFLQNKKIIIPSKKFQQEIINHFDKLQEINQSINKKKQFIQEYIKSVYSELFGDPIQNEKKFPIKKIENVAKVDMGGTPSTKIRKYYQNGTIFWMKSGDIKGDYITEVPNKITEEGLKNSNAKLYTVGDVVIALNGQGKTRGTTSILAVLTSSNQSVASISPNDELTSEYLHYNLKYRYQEIRNITGDKERSGLNLSIIRSMKIIVPPIQLQKKFSKIIKEINNINTTQIKQKEELLELQNSFTNKYFSESIEMNV
jgi:type I restriction enzyme S subunit